MSETTVTTAKLQTQVNLLTERVGQVNTKLEKSRSHLIELALRLDGSSCPPQDSPTAQVDPAGELGQLSLLINTSEKLSIEIEDVVLLLEKI